MREFGPSALPWRRTYLGLSAGMSLAIAACTGSGGPQAEAKPASTPTYSTTLTSVETKPTSTPTPNISPLNSSLELPFGGTWFLTSGPHSDNLSRGVRYALDFAPPEIIPCPGGKPLEGRYVSAAALGKVTVVGNEKDPTDKNHSIVEIQHPNGYTTGYMHLENIKPRVGQEVKQGDVLGNPSCEYPPGGKIAVEHLQFYLKRAGLPVRISEISLSGYKITEEDRESLGNLSKPGEKIRTPDQRGCDNDQICAGIRNDLTSSSKPPSESISKPAIKPKFEVPQPTAAPKPAVQPRPTAAPKPNIKPTETIDPEFKAYSSVSLPYALYLPKSFNIVGNMFLLEGHRVELFSAAVSKYTGFQLTVANSDIGDWVKVNDFKETVISLQTPLYKQINSDFVPRAVDGQDAWILRYQFPPTTTGYSLVTIHYVFVRNHTGWQTIFKVATNSPDDLGVALEKAETTMGKIMKSFKFLR